MLSSDALSSVAYATEEILRVLVLAGAAALSIASPIALVIAAHSGRRRLFVPADDPRLSERRRRLHRRASENLGEMPALIAAGALLIDYILTVAVSIAAGVAAITSAFPHWHVNRVEMALGFVVILMIGNLRGIRESGQHLRRPDLFLHRHDADADRRRRVARR